MREARIVDHWRHLLRRVYPTRLASISYKELAFFTDDQIAFSPGITALVGGNGVGKSTLVAAVTELLSNGSLGPEVDRFDRIRDSTTTAVAFVQGEQCALAMDEGSRSAKTGAGTPFDGEYRWLDPSGFSQKLVNLIRGDTNFSDLLDPTTPITLEGEDLEIASYLVGKEYEKCEIYEITDYEDLERFPYFRVTSQGSTYGSEGMGRGELALLLTYWTLLDMRRCSILVLEEPETHVSPMSQDRLMNVVAKFCDEKAIWVIAATHSPAIVRRIPVSHIRLLTRGTGTSLVIHAPTPVQIGRILSGGVAYKGVLLVEDEGARRFLVSLMDRSAPDLFPQFEVVTAGSDGVISKALEAFPKTSSWLTVVGIYDGGMEHSVRPDSFKWPHLFLPGGSAPELLLRKMVGDALAQAEIAEVLGRPLGDVALAIDTAAGIDHHEWIRIFAGALNVDETEVQRLLVRLWAGQNPDLVEAFTITLRNAIDLAPRA